MHRALGVERGIIVQPTTRAGLGVKRAQRDFERAIARVTELGWYVKVQPEPEGFASSAPQYEDLKLPVIIDHMGRPDPARGANDPTLRKIVELLGKGTFWVMLSLVEKISRASPPCGGIARLGAAA